MPSAERLLADIATWLAAEYPDIVRSTGTEKLADGNAELRVDLHPAAPDAVFAATDAGRLTLSAPTSAVGPGYHTFVDRLAQRLGTDLSIEWEPSDATAPVAVAGPGTATASGAAGHGTATGSDRQTIERAHLARLGATLSAARDARRKGAQGIHLDTPPGVRYAFDGAIATNLGPRDDAWLEKALGDPRVAIDILPWWADATDARYLLNRALCLMWTEVRWRSPADPTERALFDEIARILWRAYPLDPSLPYPWRAWRELLDLRGFEDAAASQVREMAAAAREGPVPIGYRRGPVTVIHEGWGLEIPGSFATKEAAGEWWGGEAGRSITLAAVETGTEAGPMAPEAFLQQVAVGLGVEALVHKAGDVVGRARLDTDASSGVEVGVVEGYSAVRGRGAAVRIVFENSADWQWALDVWKALAPA